MDYHSREGAEFLTAEAFYALFSVDNGLVIDHFNCPSGADLLAFFTSLTELLFNDRLGFKRTARHLAKKLGFVVEKQALFDRDIVIIGYHH